MRASPICLTCLVLALHSGALAQDAVVPPPAMDDGAIELVLQTGHTAGLHSVDCSSDGRLAVTGDSQTAIVWDLQTGRKLRTLRLPSAAYNSVYRTNVSPDGKYVITGMKDKTVVSDTVTGNEVRELASISTATAERYWKFARAWMHSELKSSD